MTTAARSRALCWLACCSPTGYGGRYSWAFTVYLSVVEAIGSLCCAAGGVELPASCAAGLPQSTRAPGAAAHCGVGIPHGGPGGIGERAFSGTSCLARNLVTRPSKHLEPPIVARRITIV